MPEFIYFYAAVATAFVFAALWSNTVRMFHNYRLATWCLNCAVAIVLMWALAGLAVLAVRSMTWLF